MVFVRCLSNSSKVLATLTTRQVVLPMVPSISHQALVKQNDLKPVDHSLMSHQIFVAKPLHEEDIHIHTCNSNVPKDGQNSQNDDKVPPHLLKEVEEVLCSFTQGFFTHRMPFKYISPHIVLEDRIRNKTLQTAPYYNMYLNYMKMYGHMRYVVLTNAKLIIFDKPFYLTKTLFFRYAFVTSSVISSHIDMERECIDIRFRFYGIGFIKMAVMYFPRKLYKRKNVMKESSIWLEAKSTFYINKEGKVVKHILDNREVDQEKQKSIVDSLKEKIVKKTNPALV